MLEKRPENYYTSSMNSAMFQDIKLIHRNLLPSYILKTKDPKEITSTIPFTLTSKEGDGTYQAFLANETRYSALTRKNPERAKVLFDRNEQAAKARFEHLQKLVELYK